MEIIKGIISIFKREIMIERNLQLEFEEILKNVVNPFFKELAFKKNGTTFNKKLNEFVQVVNIQKSKWNSPNNISFTINVGFFSEEIYLENSNQIPKFIQNYDCQVLFRLGMIIYGNDYWYELDKKKIRENLEIQIYNDFHNSLKMILLRINNIDNLKDYLINNPDLQITTSTINKIKIFLKTGEIKKANELLRIVYENALNPEDSVAKTIRPDGTEFVERTKSKINVDYLENLKKIARDNNITL